MQWLDADFRQFSFLYLPSYSQSKGCMFADLPWLNSPCCTPVTRAEYPFQVTLPFLQGPGSASGPTPGSLSGERPAQDIGQEVLHNSCPISNPVGLLVAPLARG